MATVMGDGAAEDLIRTATQLVCAEGHYKTLIEKYNSELNNGLVLEDRVSEVLEEMNDAVDELTALSELRRGVMRRLLEDYEGADVLYWCVFKHLASAEYTAFEAWQASDNDARLMNLWLATRAKFVHAASRFLGTGITDCSSCFSDRLKGLTDDFVDEDVDHG